MFALSKIEEFELAIPVIRQKVYQWLFSIKQRQLKYNYKIVYK